MDDRELVAVVLEEPELGLDLELEAVGGRGGVVARLVSLGDAVADDETEFYFKRGGAVSREDAL